MSKGWILQKKSFGLGNFVMATPALKMLSDKKREKVKVFFETKAISSLYKNCPFIKVLGKRPGSRPVFTIGAMKRQKGESDIDALCRLLKVGKKNIPPTYVDSVSSMTLPKEKNDRCVAIFHGCLGKCFRKRKDIEKETRQYIINSLVKSERRVILLGTKEDFTTYWSKNDLKNVENYLGKCSLTESVSLLSQCDGFISNDTGLYHVAGALQKRGLVLWRKTRFVKNRSPFKGLSHCVNPEFDVELYKKAIDKYIREVLV